MKPASHGPDESRRRGRDGRPTRLAACWVVVESIENPQHDRCVDIFRRPDGTFGLEEFRRDVEDMGLWTAVSYFSGLRQSSREEALKEAARRVAWLSLP